MTLSASEIAAQMTDGLDDSLQPIDDKVIVKTDDVEDQDDEGADDDGQGGEGDSDSDADSDKDSGKEDKDGEEGDDADDDEGYSIDEIESDDSDDDKPAPVETPKPTDTLSAEQKYIVDNLAPIKLRGVVGDSEDVKEYTVYDPSQLPPGFRYLDDRDRDMAGKAFGAMEQRALQLQNDFRGQEGKKAQQAYKEQEEKADWSDIAALQKQGELPKFKLKPDDPKFDEDPTSVLIDKVLDFKDELNNKYLEDYNNGKPYRHVGFEDAYAKYLKQNPPVKKTAEEVKEDKDRKDLAKRTRGTNGTGAKGGEKPVVLGSKRDIDNYIESLEF